MTDERRAPAERDVPDSPFGEFQQMLAYQRRIGEQVELISLKLLGLRPDDSTDSIAVKLAAMEAHSFALEERIGALERSVDEAKSLLEELKSRLAAIQHGIEQIIMLLLPKQTEA